MNSKFRRRRGRSDSEQASLFVMVPGWQKQSHTYYRRNQNLRVGWCSVGIRILRIGTRSQKFLFSFIPAIPLCPISLQTKMTSEAGPSVSPAKRSSPPPPADLSKPTTGQPPAKRARNNKFDASSLPPSTDAAEILKQVEFYFSDANLPRDKFLWTQTQSDPKKEGWVPIATIASFKRMQRFRPIEAVVDALRASKELLEVNEEGTHVRRKIPLVRQNKDQFVEAMKRTVYAV